jgi:integrase
MREGELFGLRWSDVNLTIRSVHLVRQPKTKSSRRHILLSRIAADALAEHKTRQARPGARRIELEGQ